MTLTPDQAIAALERAIKLLSGHPAIFEIDPTVIRLRTLAEALKNHSIEYRDGQTFWMILAPKEEA